MHSDLNPYSLKNTEDAPSSFIGRADILGEVLRDLKTADAAGLFIYGQRCIGKTALLRHLVARLPERGEYLPVYFDLQGMAGLSLEQVLTRLIPEMVRPLNLSVPAERITPSRFERRILPFILSALPERRTLVLVFDEFDTPKMSGSRQAGQAFYPYIRKLFFTDPRRLKFIFAIGRRPGDLDRIYHSFYKGTKLHHLPMFTREETTELARLSERNQSLIWPDEQITAIREFTGGHPFLTRNLCRVIWEKNHKKETAGIPVVHFRDMVGIFPRAIKTSDRTFSLLWNGLGPWERVAASALAEAGSGGLDQETLRDQLEKSGVYPLNGGLDHAIRTLEQWGVIRAENSEYRIRINMLGRWIMAVKPFEQMRDELDRLASEFFETARALCRQDDFKTAIPLLHQTAELSPNHLKANRLLAKLLIRQGDVDGAVALLEPLYEFSFPEIHPLYLRALLLQARNAENAADRLAICEKILDIEPAHPDALAEYRMIFEDQGDRACEINDFDAALAAYARAEAHEKIRQVEQTLEQIAIAHRLNRRKKRWGLGKWFFRWTFALCLLAACGLFVAYAVYRHVSEDLPRISSLKDYRPPLITTVYAGDGSKIGEFYRERRIVIPLSRMSDNLINAFIAAEDARFFSHEGLDFISIVRAFFKNIEAGTVVQGGSTITQQVIKSFLLTPERSYKRKFKEAILAYRIDKAFSKEDILFLYLNQIYLGHGAYGVEAAAENYFGKSAKDLTLAECAMLAGLAKAPGTHSPVRRPKRAGIRQKYVLKRMAEEGYVSPKQARKAAETALKIRNRRENWYLKKVPFFTEYVRSYIEKEYGLEALYTGGLKIFTTVDPALQQAAREEVEKGLKALENRHKYPGNVKPQGALLCMETGTGFVRAMVGGRDFSFSQFNRAIQSRRQPGSAFKPVIYAAALDKGYTPMTMLYDSPIAIPDNGKWWRPGNYDHRFYGPIRLRRALAKSRNLPVVKVLRNIGIRYAVNYAHNLGIRSRLNGGLSLALGASGVSLLEMVEAYSVFANRGMRIEPVFIRKIVDRNGREIPLSRPAPEQAIEPATAFLMTSLLQSVVTGGTGYKAKKLDRPVAGKTGTTNDFRDAWFLGYTPGYVAGAWVGFDIERPLGKSETGSRAACPIWLGFMEKLLADKPVREFDIPDGVVYAKIDADSGLLAIPESPRVIREWFKAGTLPKRHAPRPTPEYLVTEPEDFFKAGL
ncbi:hypothetical protein DENIS_1551 [Desulfonema ishimotonii]|uniref:peptidoglycan glycosyltransferase n=1 Tax=Desulfonema ishimotonii TaxID=45657 RepID=A0A401FUG7_9BACT|nr:PBP1A family penicillin-binding protein [Desulfonema ishimotonii]GBC60594.1 hypothetical protein DENIS_1551 [Desulfonema ishimotonii]